MVSYVDVSVVPILNPGDGAPTTATQRVHTAVMPSLVQSVVAGNQQNSNHVVPSCEPYHCMTQPAQPNETLSHLGERRCPQHTPPRFITVMILFGYYFRPPRVRVRKCTTFPKSASVVCLSLPLTKTFQVCLRCCGRLGVWWSQPTRDHRHKQAEL